MHVIPSDHAGDDGDETYVQIGFKGESQITNDLTGYGQWEYKTYANDTEGAGDKSFNRLAYAGLKYAEFGSFDYGRNYGVVYDVEAWTDMLPVFGGDSYTWTDNFMNGRANGLATYRNSGFFGLVDGLNFALQYQGNNEGGPHEDQTVIISMFRKAPKTVMKMYVSRTATASVCPPPMTSTLV